MTIAYFDCFSGISGDMCLGAIVDAGLPLRELEKELKKFPLTGYRLSDSKVNRGHLRGTKVNVLLKRGSKAYPLKRWKDVRKMIQDSSLSFAIKNKGLSVFRTLFLAEAKVHGRSLHTVHLHELGAVDCMVDVFGTIIGLHLLGVEKMCSSPVNLGSGMVITQHGVLPVPAPATAEILRNIPVYSRDVQSELTTPTGAAIIKELSSGHGDLPIMDIEKIGIGAGTGDFPDWPNVLRIFIGTPASPPGTGLSAGSVASVFVIETNIDDMNPQIFDHVTDMLYKAGSLDVSLTQVIMKKGRPGVKMTVICDKGRTEAIITIILRETSSIGLRYYETQRKVMQREIKTVDTEFGKIRFKVSRLGDEIIKAAPEYEDCRKIARKLHIPLVEVMKKIQHKESP
jgi:hypothetical protein